ncbi:MAG: hypothetical protein IJ255_02695 [Bacteroidales bacterium]|nr:hypothetical protein [Bacteroidales bacterium]
MNEWEKYIRDHAPAFDTEVPAGGAEERFLNRLEGTRTGTGRTVRMLRWLIPAAAAILLVVLLPVRRESRTDWFEGVADNPYAVYERYLAEVFQIWQSVGPDETASDLLRDLTEETIPLAEQLPDEIPEAEQAAILQDYYGTLLDEAARIHEITKNSIQ